MKKYRILPAHFFQSDAVRIAILFLAILGASSLLIQLFHVPFGNIDFFYKHGFLFLVCITFFPRLTLFFSSVPFGGLFWWLGFFFMPRLLIACLATVNYWHTNPVLVTIAWIVAFSGESTEKIVISKRRPQFQFRSVHMGAPGGAGPSGAAAGGAAGRSKTVEAEYKITD